MVSGIEVRFDDIGVDETRTETVHRAITYMQSHLRDNISIGDIARSSYVSPRAVQLAFRHHYDTTPMAYLRHLRLCGAHAELVASSPRDGATVTMIATSWCFGNPGRFAIEYGRVFGEPPHVTLGRRSLEN